MKGELAVLFWWRVGVGTATEGALTTSVTRKPWNDSRDAGIGSVDPLDVSGFAVLKGLVIFSYSTLSSKPNIDHHHLVYRRS